MRGEHALCDTARPRAHCGGWPRSLSRSSEPQATAQHRDCVFPSGSREDLTPSRNNEPLGVLYMMQRRRPWKEGCMKAFVTWFLATVTGKTPGALF